jgi:hypothetical protein
MLPPIGAVVSVDMIRDGGSLAATFYGNNGAMYSLWYKLRQERIASGEFVRLGYERPVVFEHFEFREGSERSAWQSLNEIEVSWNHALILLHQMHPYLRDDTDRKWLGVMEEVATTEGRLPSIMRKA